MIKSRPQGIPLSLVSLLFFAGLLIAGWAFVAGRSFTSSDLGAAASFRLPLLQEEGRFFDLSEWTEQGPVLIAFWASWCPPCVKEIPILNQWQKEYGPRGLKIIAVNLEESREHLEGFLERHPIHYPVAMDLEGAVASRYGVAALPVTVMLAKGGEIIYYGFSLPQIEDFMKSSETFQEAATL